MTGKLFAHLRHQWLGALALFLVLAGGVAYGANTVFSADIVDGEVFSADVRDDTLAGGGLGAVDLQPGSVRTSEIADGSVSGSDVNEASLGIVPNANTLDGLDSARFKNTSKEGTSQCNNLSVNNAVCASVTPPGLTTGDDLLLLATWRWYGDATGPDSANCFIKLGGALGSTVEFALFGQNGNEHNQNSRSAMGSMVAIDSTPEPAPTYSLVCGQTDGKVHIPTSAKIAAIRLSG